MTDPKSLNLGKILMFRQHHLRKTSNLEMTGKKQCASIL